MQACSAQPTQCAQAHAISSSCNPADIITMEHVRSFFVDSASCTATIAYLDLKNKLRKTESILARKVDDDCYLHFSEYKGFYYVYDDIMQLLLAWIKDPADITFQAIVGNHLTIGYNERTGWDIHERLYHECKQEDGSVLLSKNRSHDVRYKVVNNLLMKQTRGRPSSLATAKHVWNDICCWLEKQEQQVQETQGGNQKMIRRPFRQIPYYKNVKEGIQDARFLAHFELLRNHGKKDEMSGVMRIPYLKNETDADTFCDWLYAQTWKKTNQLVILTDHDLRCSALIMNMFV